MAATSLFAAKRSFRQSSGLELQSGVTMSGLDEVSRGRRRSNTRLDPTFSLVIPCYNEQDSIAKLGAELSQVINEWPGMDVVLVENGSTDGTRAEIQKLTKRSKSIRMVAIDKNQGYGFGVKTGLRVAQGRAVAWTHADLQCHPRDTLRGMEIFERHDRVFVRGLRVGRAAVDRFFSFGMAFLASIIFLIPLRDINAQPNIFPSELLGTLLDGPDDFSFELYAMVLARKLGYEEKRFPVFFGKRYAGLSSWNVSFVSRLKLSFTTLSYCFKLKRRLRKSADH